MIIVYKHFVATLSLLDFVWFGQLESFELIFHPFSFKSSLERFVSGRYHLRNIQCWKNMGTQWTVCFWPSISCARFHGRYFVFRYYGTNRNKKLDDFLSDIAFFNGKCYSCSLCDKEFDCPSNLSEISTKVNQWNARKKKCEQFWCELNAVNLLKSLMSLS